MCHLLCHFRGHPAGGCGWQWGIEEPMADPHPTQVLLCVCPFIWGEAGLDGSHRGLPVEPAAGRQPPTWFRLCIDLDSRSGSLQMHALLPEIHCDQTASPLPKMWFSGLQLLLQTATVNKTHSPHEKGEGVQSLPQQERERWHVSPEGRQQWKG